MADRLLYLENPVELHEQVAKEILRLLKTVVVELIIASQNLMEGEKYVTVSLLVLYIIDIR